MERDIIDLTGTNYMPAPIPLSCSIIELDDSIVSDAPGHSLETQTNSPDVTVTRPKPVRRRKRKPSQPVQQNAKEIIRDRSPLRTMFGDCPICYDYIGKNPLAATRCGHVYCQKCLEQSLKIEKKCPTCRKPIRGPKGYHPLYLSPNE